MAGNLTAMIASIFSGGVTADPYFEYTTLLLPGTGTNGAQNNTFLDGSTNNFTITRNGNTTQGTFSPFSQTGWGNYFDGTGDSLTVSYNAAFEPSSSDFTIEGWYFLTETGVTENPFFVVGSATYYPIGVSFLSSTGWKVQINASYTGSAWAFNRTGTTTVSANTWVHVAVVRNSTSLDVYVNGTKDNGASGAIAGSLASGAGGISLGAYRAGGTAEYFGYMSNVRYVVGSAVYTGNFTPSTSPLTAITNTKLLTCQSNRFIDNSTLGSTITRNGDTSVVAFSPFNPNSSWSAATYGGSGYFDGSGDFLTVANATELDMGSGDFTIEFWWSPLQVKASGLFCKRASNANYSPIYLATTSTNQLNLFTSTSGSSWATNSTTTATFPVNGAWVHVAVVRYSNNMYLYANGVSVISPAAISGALMTNTAPFVVGSNDATATNNFACYISGFRIVKGVAVYTGAFTPPTAPITDAGSTSAASYPSTTNVNTSFASSATSLLLNFTNAGVYDATSKNDLETVGNAQISTTQSKWGGSSISFDGTGDWLLIPDQPPQRIGTGKFTIELWVYRNSSGTYGLVGKGTSTTGWLVSLNSSNQVVFTYASSTITSTGTVSATTWTHIAVVREGTSTNQTKIYINGTNDGTGTVSTDFNQTNSMYVGADRTGGSAANAYVQDVRITNDARYTANFTAPTAAFPTL